MATELFGVSPGMTEFQVVQGAGSATAANAVELTVDCAATIVNDNGTTRKISREEVLIAIEQIKNTIIKSQWPPV